MVLSAAPPNQSPAITSLLDQIADELAQDQNLSRIKKLMLYVCTGTWETDPRRLERAPLRVLVQHLFEISLTFESLQQQIDQAVASLNKSAEYRIVANSVMGRFSAVYAELQSAELPMASQAFSQAFYGPIYRTIAEDLQQNSAQTRIKKLLVLTCRSTWENNLLKLEQISFVDLVRELHQIAPNPQSLRVTLHQVAKALSKPEEYTQVAETVRTAFQALYQAGFDEPVTHPLTGPVTHLVKGPGKEPVKEPTGGPVTELRPIDNRMASGSVSSLTELRPAAIQPAAPHPQPAYAPLQVVTKPSTARSTGEAQPSKPALKVLRATKTRHTADLFDLRLEIMHDTNPLKAKILLFSLLHTLFQDDADHEALLKTHELDDLFRILFLSYRLYTELEDKLRQTARALNSDEYLQSAEAILRAIQPFYAIATPELSPDLPMPSADITDMKVDTHEITQPD